MPEFTFQFSSFFRSIGWKDLIDICIVAFLIYEVLRLIRGTRAVQMAAGLVALAILYQISRWFGLDTVEWVLRNVVMYLGFGIIVLFQRELRAALLHFGKNFRQPFAHVRRRANAHEHVWYDDVVQAAVDLAKDKIGALIVLERDVGLKHYIESGVRMDARLTYDLLVTVFNTNTLLHDGAAIISKHRLAAASCFLPLTQDPRIARKLGTRHRAAIGITEDTDAVAIVVSEETGHISFAVGGHLTRNLDAPRLRRLIQQAMEPWHTDEEAEALELEEREHEQELQKILEERQANVRGRHETPEPFSEKVPEEVKS
ncbi:MAG TPA: diadenylate cyclase CdaA [Blastocatellia bacterium]|nr:diadenylate cyclase CdaA [Blastocatellia bacterium]